MTNHPTSPKTVASSVLMVSMLMINSGPVRKPFSPIKNPPVGSNVKADYVPGQILVKFKSEAPAIVRAAALAASESQALRRIPRLDVYVVRIPDSASVEEMVAVYQRNSNVEYAEPNYFCRSVITPNDTLFKYQYALSNIGQVIGNVPGSPQGKVSADIKAPQAWEEAKGDSGVVIAILDTGVDMGHPDLKNKILNAGKDFINNDLDATDDSYHGTAVAGVAAAETDNNEGIAGVAWNSKILPVKVLDATGLGSTDKVADGIRWAAEQGVRVINLSLGSDAPSQALRDAVQYAFEKGCVIVAAAGNNGGPVLFPAAYDNYVLAVAATDYNDERWTNSNTGAEVDVAAPGVRILTTVPTWYFGLSSLPYGYADGTSLAAPQVSGLAALIKGLKPWLTPAEIMNIIRFSADDINAANYKGKDEFIGYGRINLEKALVPLKLTKTPQ